MKERIYGNETEYAILITGDHDKKAKIKRIRIYELIENLIGGKVKVLPADYRKKGIFLENGGLFNYEALHSNFLEGLIEMATPECKSARDVALYQAAQSNFLQDTIKELNNKIRNIEVDFKGKIFIGKSNVDSDGKCISTHENYLVEDEPGLLGRIFLYLIVPLFWLSHLLLLSISYIPFIFVVPLILFAAFVSGTIGGIMVLIPGLKKAGYLLKQYFVKNLLNEEFLINNLIRYMGEFSRIIYSPWVFLYSTILKFIIFSKIKKNLLPFLITRIIFTGSGRINIPSKEHQSDNKLNTEKIFQISQRANAIKDICRIYFDDSRRPIFDMRDFFLEPLSVLKKRKRLHILLSDSNMSSISVYLKFGVTGLILRMIEDGIVFNDAYLKNPLESLKAINNDSRLKLKIRLQNKKLMSAIEIQKYYLEMVKEYYKEIRKDDMKINDIIEKWEYILDTLEINPHLLYRKIDWVTKKDLIEEVIRERKI